ncbi:MAG: WecB/TagA/CpsF family glycosyltransferase [Candidatus Aureabacteria bacterium]|nr:WecB/TagA/CpsF family glycosyltransferase [Candidatus Auribacterota bacterium]
MKKVNILGVNINRINMANAVKVVSGCIDSHQKIFIAVPNVFVVTECNKDKEYKKTILSADIAFPDGLPLVWSSRLLNEYTGGRVTGPDFFVEFHKIAEKQGYSSYYLGGGPGGSEKVVKSLRVKHPALKIAGNFSPQFGELPDDLNNKIIEGINAVKPNILWVGMGAPRQELWIYKNLKKLDVNVAIGVGAVFDYEAGKTKRAPLWMQKIGMEWSYRIICQDPTLFWRKRYYAYLWEFIFPVFLQAIRQRIFKIREDKR